MAVEIIPAILAKDEKEFRRKIDSIKDFCDTVQVDVMDGTFAGNATFSDASRVDNRIIPVPFEVHLMVADPLSQLQGWSLAGAERAIIHAETVEDLPEALRQVKMFGMEPGLTLNPDTPLEKILDAIPFASVVQVMGVTPGDMGRPFHPEALETVRELRKRFPDLIISVDGGVAVGIARELAEAGADRLVAGSAIFNSGSPAKALEDLQLDANPDET